MIIFLVTRNNYVIVREHLTIFETETQRWGLLYVYLFHIMFHTKFVKMWMEWNIMLLLLLCCNVSVFKIHVRSLFQVPIKHNPKYEEKCTKLSFYVIASQHNCFQFCALNIWAWFCEEFAMCKLFTKITHKKAAEISN